MANAPALLERGAARRITSALSIPTAAQRSPPRCAAQRWESLPEVFADVNASYDTAGSRISPRFVELYTRLGKAIKQLQDAPQDAPARAAASAPREVECRARCRESPQPQPGARDASHGAELLASGVIGHC